MCFLLHQISITDFHCLLSFLFKKGSKELWYLPSDYQRHVKFHWSSSWNSGSFPALPSPTYRTGCPVVHVGSNTHLLWWGTITESAQAPQRGMRRSSACVRNLESGKNRLGKILIENGNKLDVLVTSTNHYTLCCV